MRIAELYELRKLRIVDGSIEDPGPGQVQVRVEAVGICGSDLHEFAEGGIGGRPCKYPMVMGHEPTGVVVKTGPGATGCAPGDRAAFEPAIYCYHCEFCLVGHYNLCLNMRFLSSPGNPGFFQEYLNLPVECIMPLPAGVGFVEGTLFEPLAVVLLSMTHVAIQPLETAAVFGAGPIGLLTLIMLKMCGAGRVWVVEPVPHRRQMAMAAGADAVLDPHGLDSGRQILSDTANRGVDVTIDCAAKENSVNQCMRATRRGGRLVVTGVPAELEVPFDMHTARRQGLSIYNTRRSNHMSQLALQLLREYPGRFFPVITHTLPLEKIQPAFNMLENYTDGAGKVVISLTHPA